jgi:hypothetical protein
MIVLTILCIIGLLCVGIFGCIIGMAIGFGAGYEQATNEYNKRK